MEKNVVYKVTKSSTDTTFEKRRYYLAVRRWDDHASKPDRMD